MQNGKGDLFRKVNKKKFDENFLSINWGPTHKPIVKTYTPKTEEERKKEISELKNGDILTIE
jgi:hypothetical protein